MENNLIDDDSRFSLNFNDVNFVSDSGTQTAADFKEQLHKQQTADVKVVEKLNVGDVVQLKGVDYLVAVQHVDFEIAGVGTIDYAGSKYNDDESDNLVLFNQKDIQSRVDKIENTTSSVFNK